MPEASSPNPTTPARRIALVAGYHPCSYPPPVAYEAGLRERFAVVLSSYRPDKDGVFFDADLFVRLAAALLRVVPHDSLAIETGGGSSVLRSLPELSERYARLDESERDPPLRMRASLGDRLVAVGETEAWAAVGGPAPYHDSFTLSLYTVENRAVEFRAVCEAVAHDGGVTVTAFHEALGRREPFVPWWRRPLRWLGVRPW
jgi:hypothetical protein